jgi:hypothetical protein
LIETELGISSEIAQMGQSVELSAAAYKNVPVERTMVHKDSIMSTLSALKLNLGDTLNNVENRLSEDDNAKLDSLYYILEKLQDNIAELRKEIS